MLAYARKLKNFNFFSVSDARQVNLPRLYTLAKVLSVLSKNRLFGFSSTSIYQTSIVRTPFSLSQHTSMLAAGISLLAYKYRVYGVL